MVTGSDEFVIWASIDEIGVSEDHCVTVPKVVVKESGTPIILAACR